MPNSKPTQDRADSLVSKEQGSAALEVASEGPRPGCGNDAEIDILELVGVLARNRWIILGVTLLFTVMAVGAAYLMTPVYRAELVMAPAQSESGKGAVVSQLGGLASLAGISLGGDGTDKATALATLESRSFTMEFIRRHELLPKLFPRLWNQEKNGWAVGDPADVPSLIDGVKVLSEIRSVKEDKVTGLVTVTVEWTDPREASSWTNLMVADLNASLRQAAIEEAERSISYLSAEAKKSKVIELQTAIYGLIEEQVKQIMLANVRTEYAFKVLDPALPPEPEDFVKPKRDLMVALGIVVGSLFGGLAAYIREAVRRGQSS